MRSDRDLSSGRSENPLDLAIAIQIARRRGQRGYGLQSLLFLQLAAYGIYHVDLFRSGEQQRGLRTRAELRV